MAIQGETRIGVGVGAALKTWFRVRVRVRVRVRLRVGVRARVYRGPEAGFESHFVIPPQLEGRHKKTQICRPVRNALGRLRVLGPPEDND